MRIPTAEHEARLAQALLRAHAAKEALVTVLAQRVSAEAGTGSAKGNAKLEEEQLRYSFEGRLGELNLARLRYVQAWGQLPEWAR